MPWFLVVLLCICASGMAERAPGALDYLIATHDSIPQNAFDAFAVDYLLPRRGTLRVVLHPSGEPDTAQRTWSIRRTDGLPHVFYWDGRVRGQALVPGEYALRFEVQGSGSAPITLPLLVTPPTQSPALAVTTQALYLPADDSDAAVWRAITAPVVVVDADALSHQALYLQPASGAKAGEVHGQTAGLQIMETDIAGYARVGAWATPDGSYAQGYIRQDKLKTVIPNQRWGLVIDKNAQTMSVYHDGRRVGIIPVSTGLMAANKLFRETRAGAFLTQDRIKSFDSEGFRYDFAIRIDGGNLIHQMGYRPKGADFTEHTAQLGQKASNGCVRVPHEPSPQGISARWLWERLPRNTKVLVLDDPAARAMRLEALHPTPAPVPTQRLSDIPVANPDPLSPPPERTTISLTFSGDSIIGSEEKSRKREDSFDSIVGEKGYDWPFSGLREWFTGDDLTVINFEGTLQDSFGGRETGKMHWFRGPTRFVEVLRAGSVELAGLANNHVLDYGNAGRKSTKNTLHKAGVATFGYGELYVFEKDGVRIGYGGIRETTWTRDRQRPAREIGELKSRGAHFIVYTMHAGTEYQPNHNALQTEMARSIIDAGADLVVGAHPHVVQGVERYGRGTVFYSLGNFVFGGNLQMTDFDALVLRVTLHFRHQTLEKTAFTLVPVLTSGARPLNDFRPVQAEGEDKARILRLIQEDSGEMDIKEDMEFMYPSE